MGASAVSAGFVRAVFLSLLTAVLALPVGAQYGGGAGTPEDPYLIFTTGQFRTLGASPCDWDKHFKLMADLDLSSHGPGAFLTIGTLAEGPFTGVFDGNHKTLSNLRRSSDYESYLGLFGLVEGWQVRIRNVILLDPSILSETGRCAGALIGSLRDGVIENCHVRGGTVRAESFVGGLVGKNESGRLSDCTARTRVCGSSRVGGLIGETYFGRIVRCWAAGEVSGLPSSFWIGGLIGSNRNGTVQECRACGPVQGALRVGGLIGENLTAAIDRCCAAGRVDGQERVGGFVGQNSGGTVTDCYATGAVAGSVYAGGLAGCNGPSCECTVYTPGVILRCYASGPVQGTSRGGLVGVAGKSETHLSFWDIEATGCTQSAGGDGGTAEDLSRLTTYLAAGWDFVAETQNGTEDVWCLPAGGSYPRLAWELADVDLNADGRIDLKDFGRLATRWRRADPGVALIVADGNIGAADLMDFTRLWLAGSR